MAKMNLSEQLERERSISQTAFTQRNEAQNRLAEVMRELEERGITVGAPKEPKFTATEVREELSKLITEIVEEHIKTASRMAPGLFGLATNALEWNGVDIIKSTTKLQLTFHIFGCFTAFRDISGKLPPTPSTEEALKSLRSIFNNEWRRVIEYDDWRANSTSQMANICRVESFGARLHFVKDFLTKLATWERDGVAPDGENEPELPNPQLMLDSGYEEFLRLELRRVEREKYERSQKAKLAELKEKYGEVGERLYNNLQGNLESISNYEALFTKELERAAKESQEGAGK